MDFRRILANAVARRVAALLVAAALAWMGTGRAEAACTLIGGNPSSGFNNGDWACSDQAEAYAKVASMGIPSYYASCGMINVRVVRVSSNMYGQRMTYPGGTCGIGYQQDIGTGSASFPQEMTCSSRSSITSTFNPKSGSISCSAGCSMTWYRNADGTSTAVPNGSACTNAEMPQNCVTGEEFWNPILNVCEPMTPDCPAGQTLNSRGICGPEECPAGMKLQADNTCGPAQEECPAGNVKAPSGECLPGDGQCAAGEARTKQGTCGRDTDGDGVPDVEDPDIDGDGIPNEEDPDQDGDGNEETPEEKARDKREASGGDSCAAPPSCSGDAIACMQVKIQWRIDCNTRTNRNISGGSCAAVPVCTGEKCDAMEYASLIQQWKSACALEKLVADGGSSGGDNNADITAIKDALTGSAAADPGGEGNAGDAWEGGGSGGAGNEYNPDGSGYGYGSSCPTVPTVNVMGTAITFDIGPLCQWVGLAGNIVFALAALASLRIVASKEA